MIEDIELPHLPECLLSLPLETLHDIQSHTYHAIKADRQQRGEPVEWPTHEFAIVVDRMYEGEGPSLAMWNGENYNFTDGDCYDREPDGSLDGYTAEWLTHHQLERRLFAPQPTARAPESDYAALEKEHLGCPEKSTGIYAALVLEPVAYFQNANSVNGNPPHYEQVCASAKNDPDVFPLFSAPQPHESVKSPRDDDIDIEDVRKYLESWGCISYPGVSALLARYGQTTTPKGWRLVPVVPTSKQICHMAMRITGADEDGWYRTNKGDWPECVEKAEQAYQQALENAPKFGEE